MQQNERVLQLQRIRPALGGISLAGKHLAWKLPAGVNTSSGRLTMLRVGLLALAIMLCVSDPAHAQQPQKPIDLTQLSDWNWGTFLASPTAGTITMTPTGAISSAGGVTPFNTVLATPSPAMFKVTGDAGATYSIVFAGGVTLNRVGGGGTMTIDGFKSSGTGILSGGTETITIGATMHVGALQPSGSYIGTNSISVMYN